MSNQFGIESILIFNCCNGCICFVLSWQLFGYFQSEDEEPDQILSEDISVFTVSKKHRIGEAAGTLEHFLSIYCLIFLLLERFLPVSDSKKIL